MKSILITGVSSGIGLETAKKFLKEGWIVFGSVRNTNDAKQLEEEGKNYFITLHFDVCNAYEILTAADIVKKRVGERGLDCVINNAGIATAGPLLHMPIHEFQQQLDVNVTGLLRVTQAFAPLLKADKKSNKKAGRLINISSMSGLIAKPFLGAYAASKFAIEALSDALRREFMSYDIDVIVIEPGPVKTPIWGKSKHLKPRYQDTDYADVMSHINHQIDQMSSGAICANRVVKIIYKAVHSPKPKTRYMVNANHVFTWFALNIFSDRSVDKMFHKQSTKLAQKIY